MELETREARNGNSCCLSLFPDLINVSLSRWPGATMQDPVPKTSLQSGLLEQKMSLLPQACAIHALERLFPDLGELNPIIHVRTWSRGSQQRVGMEVGRHRE